MEKAKHKKFNTILYIGVLVAILLMFSSSIYLYYVKVMKPKETNIVIKNYEMLLMFNGEAEINAHNIKPGWTETKEFSIENFSEDTIGRYKIVLEVITPLSNMIDDSFVYTLEGETTSKDTTNKVVNVSETPVPVITKELGTAVITPKSTQNYKLTFNIKNNNKKYGNNIFAVKVKVVSDN